MKPKNEEKQLLREQLDPTSKPKDRLRPNNTTATVTPTAHTRWRTSPHAHSCSYTQHHHIRQRRVASRFDSPYKSSRRKRATKTHNKTQQKQPRRAKGKKRRVLRFGMISMIRVEISSIVLFAYFRNITGLGTIKKKTVYLPERFAWYWPRSSSC